MDPRQKLAAAFLRVCDSHTGLAPYLGSVLRGLIRVESDKIKTLAVTNRGVLLWSPKFVTDTSSEDLAFGLMHEAMHLLRKHFERTEALGVAPVNFDAVNQCQDACINEQLREIKPDLPKGWIFPETLKQAKNLTFEERYRLLPQKDGGGNGDKKAAGSEDKDADGGESKGVGKGSCGSCAGNPGEGEPSDAEGRAEGRSEAELERFRRDVAEQIKDCVSKNRGRVPGGWQRWADETLSPPKVDWRRKLAAVTRAAIAYRSGAVDFDWSRISRRQAGVGFGIGRPGVPAFKSSVPRVGVIMDTSGSMSREALALAASEVQGILTQIGAKISLCVVDADVQGVRKVARISDVLGMLKGGGGTDMTPGFEALLKERPAPEVLIVLTDGYLGDGFPQVAPVGVKIVWCIIGDNDIEMPYGDTVHIDFKK